MDKRLFTVTALLMAVATIVYACRATGTPDASPPAAAPAPAATPSAPVTGSPASTVPVAPDHATPAATATPVEGEAAPADPAPAAAVAPAGAPSSTPIRGSSPAPTTGKPVAAIDVDWELVPDPAVPGAFTGTIGATNQAGGALVTLSVEAVGDLALLSAASIADPALGRGARLVLPVSLRLAPGTAAAGLLVTVRVEAGGIRSRVVGIPLRSPPALAPDAPEKAAPTGGAAGGGLQGERTVTGSDGQTVHFLPAAGQP